MGSIFKSLWERIFGRTLTEEESYGRRMRAQDMAFQWCIKNVVYNIFDVNDFLVAEACDMSMGGQLEVAS